MPSASASSALITSPCETATQTAPSPCSAATWALVSRAASTARACTARSDSPPGNVTALAWRLDDLPERVLGQGASAAGRSSRRTGTRPSARRRRARAAGSPGCPALARRTGDGRDRGGRLLAALERAGDDVGERHGGQPLRRRRRPAPARARPDGRPGVQPARVPGDVRGRAAVSDQDQGGHRIRLRGAILEP